METPLRRPYWSLSTKRVRLTVAYDGTDFCGWAAQPGRRTVQGTLTEAVRQISGEENEIHGASRTDSGAHARGQCCHFDVRAAVPIGKWPGVLNKVLPSDICVRDAKLVPSDFESRFWAQDRFYRYRILVGKRDPFRERFAHYYGRNVNVEAMHQAAQHLTGEQDYLAFTEELADHVENTRRTLYSIQVKQVADEVRIDIVGTAFLRGMMRRISGCLLEIGRGHRPASEVPILLSDDRHRLQWPVVLPAKGLCLMRIRYGRHPQDHRTTS